MTAKTKVVILSNHFADVENAITGDMLMRSAQAGGGVVETFAKLNASRGRPGLNVDTGNLVNSIGVTKGQQSDTYAEALIGTGVEYAAIHEFGGVIRPSSAKYLSIPMNGATGSPKKYSDLHFVSLEGGGSGLLIDGSGTALFFMAKMVHIPARPYLRPALDEHDTEITAAMETVLAMQIERACGK